MSPSNPLDVQVGGAHYKNVTVQPIQFSHKNKLIAGEFSVLRYILRWRTKNGLEDIQKAEHYIRLMIQGVLDGEIEAVQTPGLAPELFPFLDQYPFLTPEEIGVLTAVMMWRHPDSQDGLGFEPRVDILQLALELFPAIQCAYEDTVNPLKGEPS